MEYSFIPAGADPYADRDDSSMMIDTHDYYSRSCTGPRKLLTPKGPMTQRRFDGLCSFVSPALSTINEESLHGISSAVLSARTLHSYTIINDTPSRLPRYTEDMRGSKRSRDEYEAQEQIMTEQPRVTTLYQRFCGMIRAVKDYWLAPRRPIAVESTPEKKRRRIEMQTPGHDLPGSFPAEAEPAKHAIPETTTQLPTPPDSRPASSDGPAVEENEQKETLATLCPERYGLSVRQRLHEINSQLNTRRGAPSTKIRRKVSERCVSNIGTPTAPPAIVRNERDETTSPPDVAKDRDIDCLLDRAKGLSVSRRRYRESIRQYNLAKSQAKEAELAKEREAKQAEEDKRLAEEAAEAAKLKAEQEAAEDQRKAEEAATLAREQLIKPLDAEWTQKLNSHMSKGKDHIIAMSPDGNDLTRHDFATLIAADNSKEASAWLNDEIVNAFLSTIVQRKLEQAGYVKSAKTVPNYVTYNTAWHNTYKAKGIDGIKSWSRRKHIQGEKLLQAERVFFPINTGTHWMLLIISPKERKLEYLDSLHGRGRTWFDFGRKWLQMELGDKYKEEEWTESTAKSSPQLNFNDCGAFTCFNALANASGVGYEKVRGEDMQDGRKMLAAVLCGFEAW